VNRPLSRASVARWNLTFQYITVELSIVSGIVLVPMYLRNIPLSLYGAWLASGNILNWLTTVDPGLSTVLQREIACAYGRRDLETVGKCFWAGIILTTIIVGIFALVGFCIVPHVFELIKIRSEDVSPLEQAFSLQIVATSIFLVSFTLTALNSGLLRCMAVGWISVAAPLAGLMTTITLLLYGEGLLALPSGSLVCALVTCFGNAIYAFFHMQRDRIPFVIEFDRVKSIAKLLSFSYFARIAGVIYENFDLFITSRYLGPEVVPILSLTRRAPDVVRRFTDRPIVALMPTLAHLVGQKGSLNAKHVLLRAVRFVIWLVWMCAAGFLVLNPTFIRLWVGPSFFAGPSVNIALVILFVVSSLNSSISSMCFALGDIKGTSVVSFLQTVVCIPLVIFAVTRWGIFGLVVATILPLALINFTYCIVSFLKRLELTRTECLTILGEALRCFLVAATVALICETWQPSSTWTGFLASGVAVTLMYVALLFFVSTSFRTESSNLVSWIWPQRLQVS
jgi:O-antigen/teichoic acid export membrane protein